MNKKSLFLFFILLTGLKNSYALDDFQQFCLGLAGIVGGSYITYKAYYGYQAYIKASRTDEQVVKEARLCYERFINLFQKSIINLNENSELDIIRQALIWFPDATYPCICEHNWIQETVIPQIVEHKAWIQERIDKHQFSKEFLAETHMLLNNFDILVSDLKKIDNFIVASNRFNEEKKHKELVSATYSYDPPMIIYTHRS